MLALTPGDGSGRDRSDDSCCLNNDPRKRNAERETTPAVAEMERKEEAMELTLPDTI